MTISWLRVKKGRNSKNRHRDCGGSGTHADASHETGIAPVAGSVVTPRSRQHDGREEGDEKGKVDHGVQTEMR
jgi:hypothetical protein